MILQLLHVGVGLLELGFTLLQLLKVVGHFVSISIQDAATLLTQNMKKL